MKDHDLPPNAPSLMESTRAIGYSIETAVADIVDNSIAAESTQVKVNFFPVGSPYISILDNGVGMTETQLIEAMRYGSNNPLHDRPDNDLGRFGLGLKTASMSQCRKLTVISKKGNKLAGAQWDLDYIARTSKWTLRILGNDDFISFPHIDKIQSQDSGTLVIWQELDRLIQGEVNFERSMGKYMETVEKHLSLVFHRYLKGETGIQKVNICMNNAQIGIIDPFLTGKSTQVMDDEIINLNGNRVTVRPYLLPHISLLNQDEIQMLGGEEGIRKQQGFYVYRNKRLLIWGTWFRMMRQGELSKLARVRIDIPNSLDSLWTLDIKKSMAIPPEIIRKNVSKIIEKLGDISKRTWTYRGKKETTDQIVHIWNRLKTREGGVLYQINRQHPLFDIVIDQETKKIVNNLLTQVENSLPINQLYVDLTSDHKIENENEVNVVEMEQLLNNIISGCKTEREKKEIINKLNTTEPFNQHPELLSEMLQEVL